MPGQQMLGLTDANALGVGGQNQGTEAGNIDTQVQNLIMDMERVKDALWGNAGTRFSEGMNQFALAYNSLAKSLGLKAIDLSEADRLTKNTDDNMEVGLAAGYAGIGQVNV